MIDILILCPPADEARAGRILDALDARGAAGKYRTRFVASAPMDADWRACEAQARSAACVVLCWSRATADPVMAAYRAFGHDLIGAGKAVSVELDAGALPAAPSPAMAAGSVYSLDGARLRPVLLSRLLFGNPHFNLIVAAATEKAQGRDPPPPASVATIRRNEFIRRMLLVGGPIGLLSAIAGIATLEPVRKAMDPATGRAFAAARASGTCDAMKDFSGAHPGSAWAGEAMEYMASCRPRARVIDDEQRFRVHAGMLDLTPVASEPLARAAADAALQRLATESCTNHARNVSARIKAVRVVDAKKAACDADGRGWTCASEAWAVCSLRLPVAGE